jgi:hypothetical protein
MNQTVFTVADSTAPFEHFAKNGYYTVGNRIYNHKIHALQEATRIKQDPKWHFNDEVFGKMDWMKSSGIPLTELYRMRAQQLRQKYQYLILCWSGGADSTTILDSFLDNGIELDEVVVLWPVTQTQGKYKPTLDTDGSNMNSEWDFAIKPKIEWMKQHHPTVKVTVQDFLVEPNKNEYAQDTVNVTEKHGYVTIQKYRAFDALLEDRSEKYHVGVILGVSPVEVLRLDNYVAAYFVDTVLTGPTTDYTAKGCPRYLEYFYWSPDLPELVREQAHVMLRHMNAYPETRQLTKLMTLRKDRTFEFGKGFDHERYRTFRKALLYPNWPIQTFQANKGKDTHTYLEWYDWFYKNPHSEEYLAPWRSAVSSHQKLIDPKFFKMANGVVGGYVEFYSRYYVVGKLTDAQILR